MKLATTMLLVILLTGCFASLDAQPGTSQVAISFTGGAVWTSASTGICIWYFPVVEGMELSDLFATPLFGTPVVDKDHAYLIWVSDFSVQMLPSKPPFATAPDPLPPDWPPYKLALVPAGKATIYFTNRPDLRDWKDLTERSTWGEPVATFTRSASIIRSPDNLASDTFVFSADLVSSKAFTWNGKTFQFREVIPRGMTCFEFGQQGSSWESGTCVAR
jgi:hypothetical protein